MHALSREGFSHSLYQNRKPRDGKQEEDFQGTERDVLMSITIELMQEYLLKVHLLFRKHIHSSLIVLSISRCQPLTFL